MLREFGHYNRSRLFNSTDNLNKKGFNAHEFLLDINDIKKKTGVTEEDICKRLMDYGFHAPT